MNIRYEVYNRFTNIVVCYCTTGVFAIGIRDSLNEKYGRENNEIYEVREINKKEDK